MTAARSHSGLPRRPYGCEGDELSVIGFGGLLVTDESQASADRLVAEAVDRGVNYFDVAPLYGNAEKRLGPALKSHREKVFLACKTMLRRRDEAEQELRRSLKRLRTDHFDLYQLHAMSNIEEDLDVALGDGGALEAILEAKRAGFVRHIGFSAHSAEVALAAMERFAFDSILYPVNFATLHHSNRGAEVLQTAKRRGLSILALKALAREPWPENCAERERFPKSWYRPLTDPSEVSLALRLTLSQPVTAALTPGNPDLFRMALEIAQDLRPLTDADRAELDALAASVTPFMDTV